MHRRLNKMLNKTTFLYLFLATFLFFLWVILPKSAFAEIQTWPQTDWIESNVYYGQPTTQNDFEWICNRHGGTKQCPTRFSVSDQSFQIYEVAIHLEGHSHANFGQKRIRVDVCFYSTYDFTTANCNIFADVDPGDCACSSSDHIHTNNINVVPIADEIPRTAVYSESGNITTRYNQIEIITDVNDAEAYISGTMKGRKVSIVNFTTPADSGGTVNTGQSFNVLWEVAESDLQLLGAGSGIPLRFEHSNNISCLGDSGNYFEDLRTNWANTCTAISAGPAYLKLKAYGPRGSAGYGEIDSGNENFNVVGQPPGPFTLTTAGCYNGDTYDLDWTSSSGATSYEVWARPWIGGTWVKWATLPSNVLAYPAARPSQAEWYFRIDAINLTGTTSSSPGGPNYTYGGGCGGAPPVCGNNIVEFGEDCDGSDLNGQTCISLGFAGGGPPTCDAASCNFNVSTCTGPPIVTLTADPGSLSSPNTGSNLDWLAQNADPNSCTKSGAWSGTNQPTSGNQNTGPLAVGSHTYNISCTGPGGSGSDSVTINVTTAWSCTVAVNPNNGPPPLNGVDVTVTNLNMPTNSGNNFIDCDYNGTTENNEITNDWQPSSPRTYTDLCSYSSSGTYTVRVRQVKLGGSAEPDAVCTANVVVGGGAIAGYVYEDLNTTTCCGGVKDSGEPVLSGRTVTLTKQPSGPTYTTTTNASGYYEFINLVPGDYVVSHTTISGYVNTTESSKMVTVP